MWGEDLLKSEKGKVLFAAAKCFFVVKLPEYESFSPEQLYDAHYLCGLMKYAFDDRVFKTYKDVIMRDAILRRGRGLGHVVHQEEAILGFDAEDFKDNPAEHLCCVMTWEPHEGKKMEVEDMKDGRIIVDPRETYHKPCCCVIQ